MINAAGERLLTIAAPGTVVASEAKDRLFKLALIGADATDLIPDRDGYLLAGFVPVKNAAGDVIGAVLAAQTIDQAFMEELNFARPNPQAALIHNDEIVAQSISPNTAFTDVSDQQAFIDQALRGQGWISDGLIRDENGKSNALAYIPLTVGGEIQAVLALKSEFETLLGFQNGLIRQNSTVVGSLALVSLVVVVFFVRRNVTRPLSDLKVTSEKIAGGDLSQRVAVRSRDEIGQLAASFNTMADQVSGLVDNLEKREADLKT